MIRSNTRRLISGGIDFRLIQHSFDFTKAKVKAEGRSAEGFRDIELFVKGIAEGLWLCARFQLQRIKTSGFYHKICGFGTTGRLLRGDGTERRPDSGRLIFVRRAGKMGSVFEKRERKT